MSGGSSRSRRPLHRDSGPRRHRASRKQSRSAARWIIAGITGALTVIIAGVGLAFRLIDHTGLGEQLNEFVQQTGVNFPDSTSWPPPAGSPREEYYGSLHGDPIVAVTPDTVFNPLRRRRIDPWIEISNPRIQVVELGVQVLLLDYKTIEGPAESFTVQVFVHQPGQVRVPGLKAGLIPTVGLHTIRPDGAGKPLEIRLSGPEVGGQTNPPITDAEIYFATWDADYTNVIVEGRRHSAGPATFKVSNSVVLGNVPQLTHAREWRDAEFALLSGTAPAALPAVPELPRPEAGALAAERAPEGFHFADWDEAESANLPPHQESPQPARVNAQKRKVIRMDPELDEWNIESDADVREPVTANLPLPAPHSRYETIQGVVTDRECRQAAVAYHSREALQSEVSTRIVLCDLEGPEVVGWGAIPGSYRPVGLIDNGRRLVVRSAGPQPRQSASVEVWSLAPDGIRRESVWSPHLDGKGRLVDLDFCILLDDRHIATAERFDTSLRIWDVVSGEGRFELPISRGCRPAVSPDGRWFAFYGKGMVGVWDIAGGRLAATLQSEELPKPAFGFSPASDKLVLAGIHKLQVWDFSTGRKTHDLVVDSHGPVFLPDGNYVLIGREHGAGAQLFDLELQVPVWDFPGLEFAVIGSQLLAVAANENDRSALILSSLPDPTLRARLALATEDPALKIVYPGASVALELVGIDDPARQASIRLAVQNELAARGVTVVTSSDVKFVASVSRVPAHEIRIQPVRRARQGELRVGLVEDGDPILKSIAESVCRLSVEYQGQTAWTRQWQSWIPQRIESNPNESLDDALARHTAPDFGFFERVEIPESILRPREGQLNLGSSRLTLDGFQ